MEVEFKTIERFPGYRFGSDGSILSTRGKPRKTHPWKGYWKIVIGTNNFHVHRLILEAFRGPCPDGMEGCHGPAGKSDNSIGNLRWDTRESNQADAIAAGTAIQAGEKHFRARLTLAQIAEIKQRRFRDRAKLRVIAEEFSISIKHASAICRGYRWAIAS